MKGRVRGNKSENEIEVKREERMGGSVECCLWGQSVRGLERTEAQRERLAVFQPLTEAQWLRATQPHGLELEPEKVLQVCCYSGTHLCTVARMNLVTNVDSDSSII